VRPSGEREKLAELVFERFEVPFLAVYMDAYLALVADSRGGDQSGTVVHCGAGQCFAAGFSGGQLVSTPLAGPVTGNVLCAEITDALAQFEGPLRDMSRGRTLQAVRQILRDSCTVGESFEGALYELPDGQMIDISESVARLPESLFRPSLVVERVRETFNSTLAFDQENGIGQLAADLPVSCSADPDVQERLRSQTILTGGCTMIRGFKQRLLKHSGIANVSDDRHGATNVWTGGALLASLRGVEMGSMDREWISGAEYAEEGASVLRHKFPGGAERFGASLTKAARS
jgi:actin-related protein